ncbi:hypothetical protein A2Z33_05965 [Candidatus Gottesmanbacteria bacterium RBG_16_52_11]|uniref:Uncharacterized protein n=1 Tax=Candidatus Gottesmanbacteria bacterium RBG_16_52_11 TaxID=1798374 RepID=A0A1F5YXY9_9BACT|nr:MAG: hypothetical protein A2Z33_05965 [Candidatus Gottesmanbacteria bacterium RBG_16_52_11]
MKGTFGFVTYPSTAGIIGLIWLSGAILIIADPQLPIIRMVLINMGASILIGILGFRVEKR